MKLLWIMLISATTAYAHPYTADVNCTLSQRLVLEGTFENIVFEQAEFQFININPKDSFSAFVMVQDRFGFAFENFNQLFEEKIWCRDKSYCLNTNFSRFRGLSFEFPNDVFSNEYHTFTMRLRDNSQSRTLFASCNSSIRY